MTKAAKFGGLDRRQLMVGVGAGSILALLGEKARAEPGGQIVVSNWGGDWNDRTVRLMEQPLVESKAFASCAISVWSRSENPSCWLSRSCRAALSMLFI
jgi:hypothetical protein